jgi:hypothetical protein
MTVVTVASTADLLPSICTDTTERMLVFDATASLLNLSCDVVSWTRRPRTGGWRSPTTSPRCCARMSTSSSWPTTQSGQAPNHAEQIVEAARARPEPRGQEVVQEGRGDLVEATGLTLLRESHQQPQLGRLASDCRSPRSWDRLSRFTPGSRDHPGCQSWDHRRRVVRRGGRGARLPMRPARSIPPGVVAFRPVVVRRSSSDGGNAGFCVGCRVRDRRPRGGCGR